MLRLFGENRSTDISGDKSVDLNNLVFTVTHLTGCVGPTGPTGPAPEVVDQSIAQMHNFMVGITGGIGGPTGVAQILPGGGTATRVNFQHKKTDPCFRVIGSSSPYIQIEVVKSGRYLVSYGGCLNFKPPGVYVVFKLRVNGVYISESATCFNLDHNINSMAPADSTDDLPFSKTVCLELTAGQHVELIAINNSGMNVSVSAATLNVLKLVAAQGPTGPNKSYITFGGETTSSGQYLIANGNRGNGAVGSPTARGVNVLPCDIVIENFAYTKNNASDTYTIELRDTASTLLASATTGTSETGFATFNVPVTRLAGQTFAVCVVTTGSSTFPVEFLVNLGLVSS